MYLCISYPESNLFTLKIGLIPIEYKSGNREAFPLFVFLYPKSIESTVIPLLKQKIKTTKARQQWLLLPYCRAFVISGNGP